MDDISDSGVTLLVGEKYSFIYKRAFSDIGSVSPGVSIIKEVKMRLPTRAYDEGGKYVQFYYTALSSQTVVLQIQESDPSTMELHTTLNKELRFATENYDSSATTFLLTGHVRL
jgi:hypothetical protein